MSQPITLTLTAKHHEAGNIWSYQFEPSQPLSWVAGQFVRVELPHPSPDAEGTRRHFTIAAAPHESSIRISTRVTDSTFKQTLAGLKPGDRINLIDLPAGDFTWPIADHPPLLFAAQGIGITPFYAMLKSRLHQRLPLATTLFYTSRSPDIPFLAELKKWAAAHPEFHLTLSTDRINTATLSQLNLPEPLSHHLIYVSGPSNLITLLGPPHELKTSQLKQDFFPNYASTDY